jgi:hypothetical protein
MSASGTHGRDRKTRAIGDHDGRRVRGRRVNGREYTKVRGGVVGSTRVGDPLWADKRCQAHSAEGAHQGCLVPTGRPGRGAGRCGPRRRGVGAGRWGTSDHGHRRARLTLGSLEGPHGDAPRPRVVERGPGCTLWRCRHRVAPTTCTTSPSAATAAATAPPPLLGPGGEDQEGTTMVERSDVAEE